jgi:hypothetical protein
LHRSFRTAFFQLHKTPPPALNFQALLKEMFRKLKLVRTFVMSH